MPRGRRLRLNRLVSYSGMLKAVMPGARRFADFGTTLLQTPGCRRGMVPMSMVAELWRFQFKFINLNGIVETEFNSCTRRCITERVSLSQNKTGLPRKQMISK